MYVGFLKSVYMILEPVVLLSLDKSSQLFALLRVVKMKRKMSFFKMGGGDV